MSTYRQVVNNARNKLALANISEEVALLFLTELAELERAELYLNYEEEMPVTLLNEYEKGLERILNDEPMEYVLGFSWFYGYRFLVDENVLIPRPETEELVANILIEVDEHFSNYEKIQAVDIGTGSGAISISVVLEEPKINMMATDISEGAIKVARKNAEKLGANLELFVGDMLQPIIENNRKVDLLICNPPYIPQEEKLENSVKDYEPHVALFGGEDGLKFYREVLVNADKVLNEKAILAFEIGYDQKERLLELVSQTMPYAEAEVLMDINGKNRMLIVRKIKGNNK